MLEDLATASPASSVPRSAVRYRSFAPGTRNKHVQTPRASRVMEKPELYTTHDQSSASSVTPHTPIHVPKLSSTWLIYIVLGMLCACLLLWVGQNLWMWGNTVSDDLRYGRPRTTQVDQFVGHETNQTPSHFVAINMKGQIYVIEIPGGSPNTSHLLIGPRLYGAGADLAPATLSFTGDVHHPDLVITVQTIQVRFHNTGNSYVPYL